MRIEPISKQGVNTHMAECLDISKKTVAELLQKLDQDYRAWEGNGLDETELATLIDKNIDTYLFIQNNSTQTELDLITEQYGWSYPLFQTISDLIDGKID
jgi:hypothetical protein